MEQAFAIAALWLGLAVLATSLSNHLRVSVALTEICVGVVAGAIAERFWGADSLGNNLPWLRFLASTAAVVLTFLAGAELEPSVLRTKWKEVLLVGFVGFLAPFLGCSALAYYVLGWTGRASLLAGVALSTTSMAVVYAVMLETGLNVTDYGKGILGACFVNDLGTVVALGLLFAPFTYRTGIFLVVLCLSLVFLPMITRHLIGLYAYRTAAVRTKWVLAVLFALGAMAIWSGSEAVLPAYLIGMVLAGIAGEDHHWVRRLRTLTIGLLTPFYFIRAGALVSLPALIAAPLVGILLLGGKVVTKIFGLYPVIGVFQKEKNARWYYTLLMSTGLTFGTISALYGFSNGIVDREQYSLLVAVVIGSAVIPTLIANFVFLPKHLIPRTPIADDELTQLEKESWEETTNGEEPGVQEE